MYGAPATQETWCNLRSIHKWGDQDCDDVSAQLATFGGIMAATYLTWKEETDVFFDDGLVVVVGYCRKYRWAVVLKTDGLHRFAWVQR